MWQQCPVPRPATQLVAIEYYHQAFDAYFLTVDISEIAALDRGTYAGWQRTESWIRALGLDGVAAPVCRFWSGQTFAPKSSHFYTPYDWECSLAKGNNDWQFEGEVFAIMLPKATGACTGGTVPLYRLFNNGKGGAPNHRYTTDLMVRAEMVAQGWIPEGSGIGVIGCVPAP
jgi:hypothetical protein